VIERRDVEYPALSKSTHPGKIDQRIALHIPVTDAGILVILTIRNLVVVASHRSHQPKLIEGRLVKDKRAERAQSSHLIVQDRSRWRLETQIAAIAVNADVVSKRSVWLPILN